MTIEKLLDINQQLVQYLDLNPVYSSVMIAKTKNKAGSFISSNMTKKK